ncbi:ribonuclease R [Alsobacter sp. SYSU M60028]|uniref:Ribonuclease R n=1 Tax=Alsobacter ponti TaxID=2962936 RepID=A0ABT1LED8_9HYPH|nr:ribonuclease R [Alsobacter ponti]MCP8939867.1 ribonuclease R [Alsobacter ponti]
MSGGSSLPTREQILEFVRGETGPVGKREIARAFNVKAEGRVALKRLLREMQDDGQLDRKGHVARPDALPPVVLADVILRDRDGDLVARPTEWDEEELGKAPRISVHPPRRPRPGLAAPGVGDRVLLRIEPDREGGYSGRLIKVLAKSKAMVLGVFRADPGGGGRLAPVDKKSLGREIPIPPGDEGGASDGDLVSVALTQKGRFGLTLGKVTDKLGSLKSEKAISLVAIVSHGIPRDFSPSAMMEAEQARPATMEHREDWRHLRLVTIDPPDAKDHDDAVHARPDDDPDNPGGHVVTVAIADVAAYVRAGGALDRDALERGNSVYFPDRVVPMLPERISNDLCSLRPDEDRPALAVRLVLAADGRKKRHSFHRVMMRSRAKLAYAQAQAAIDGRLDEETQALLEPVLKPLWAAYECSRQARDVRGPLDLDLPERKIVLNKDGHVDRVIVPERLDAHRLIEEFMILANVAAAETLEERRTPLLYRVHDEPSLEKMRGLGEVLASIGIKLTAQGALRPEFFNRILERVSGLPHQALINEVVLRTQSQAEYAAENYGHFGLNLRRYAHFTSPIRRYADLIVHRALIRAMGFGKDGLPDAVLPELPEIAARISAAERRAMAAERETVDRLIAHYLSDRIGAEFEGRITGVTRAGLFVRLNETGADGFIPAGTLGADYFRYDEAAHALVGDRTGETHRLGDPATVRLVEAVPLAGALRFELLSEGAIALPRGRRPHPGKPRKGGDGKAKVTAKRKAKAKAGAASGKAGASPASRKAQGGKRGDGPRGRQGE